MCGLPLELCAGVARIAHQRARLIQRATAQERLGLREAIGHQQAVMMRKLGFMTGGCHEEFAGDHSGALMDQLVKGMLAVGARFAPDYGAGRTLQQGTGHAHALAVALHLQLLQIGGQAGQTLIVGQDRAGAIAHRLMVPETDERQHHWHILQRCGVLKMVVHRLGPGEEFMEPLRSDGDHQRQTDRPPDRIAPANVIAKAKDAGRINAPISGFLGGR